MIEVSERGDIALVEMDHPPVNAMDKEFLDTIADTFDKLAGESPDAVVLAGREETPSRPAPICSTFSRSVRSTSRLRFLHCRGPSARCSLSPGQW